MLKREARSVFKEKRMALSGNERGKLDDLLLIQFQTAELPFIETLLTYWPIEENNEPNTHLFTEFMRFRNPEVKVCYPKSNFEVGHMRAVITDIDTPFSKTIWNILEPQSNDEVKPEKMDMVFVPLLVFDKTGFRAGYGRGFYDKWLASCRPGCIKIGFSYFEPIESLDDRNEFDVPLNFAITPQNVYVF